MPPADGRTRRRPTALCPVLRQRLNPESSLQPSSQGPPPRAAQKRAYPAITDAPCQEIGCARQATLADAIARGVVHGRFGRPPTPPCLEERHLLSVSISGWIPEMATAVAMTTHSALKLHLRVAVVLWNDTTEGPRGTGEGD